MALELQGSVKATVKQYECHADKSNDGKTANVQIELDLSEAEANQLGGKEFARTCFNDYVGGSAAAGVVSKKIGNELAIRDEHSLTIEGYDISLKPSVTGCLLSNKERMVTVTLKLPIPGSAKKLRTKLDQACGEWVTILFKGVTQQDVETEAAKKKLGFDAAKGKKKGNSAEAPAPAPA